MADQDVKYQISLNDLVSPALKTADDNANRFEATLNKLGDKAAEIGVAIAAAFAVRRIIEFGTELMHVTAEFEGYTNMVKYASLGTQDAGKNIDFVKKAITDLHLPIRQAYEGFAEMQAGFYGTGIEGAKLRQVFEGISIASTVLHQTPDQFSHVTFALKEIGELGTVQARQMRMLAFALPGAMQLAATSMHMNSQQFHEAMHKGEISSNQFLMNFSKQLKEHFSSGLENASQSLIAKMNDTNNRYVELQLEMGEKLKPLFIGIMDGIISGIGVLREFWEWGVKVLPEVVAKITTAYQKVADFAEFAAVGIGLVTAAYLIANPAVIAYGFSLAADAVITGGLVVVTGVLTAAQWLLNAAMTANPVGLLIVGIGLLIAGITYALVPTNKFKAVLSGIGEVAKEVWSIMKGLGEAIIGLYLFNPKMIAEGIATAVDGVKNIKGAFSKGYNESLAESAADEAKEKKGTAIGRQIVKPDKPTPSSTKVTGTKTVNIHITIGNLVKDIRIQSTTFKESVGKVQDAVTKALTSAVNDSQIVAGE
jgi:tape measure domain-containing protein